MVKAIVLYNSRAGSTRKIAMKIAEGLESDVFDKKNVPDLSPYDLIVVGSWCMAGMLAGANLFRKLHKRNISGKKVALFFTSGNPDIVNPMTEKEGQTPKTIKECMWEKMEKILMKNDDVTILEERFYTKGEVHISKKKPPKANEGHPTEEELAQAKAFGERLRKKY
jgi:flavodoxin